MSLYHGPFPKYSGEELITKIYNLLILGYWWFRNIFDKQATWIKIADNKVKRHITSTK